MIPKRMKLCRELCVRGHVYAPGDVVEVHSEIAREWTKNGTGIDATDEPVTEPCKPRLRSEIIAENAAAQAQDQAERAVLPIKPAKGPKAS